MRKVLITGIFYIQVQCKKRRSKIKVNVRILLIKKLFVRIFTFSKGLLMMSALKLLFPAKHFASI